MCKNLTNSLPLLLFGTSGATKDLYYWIKAINKSKKVKPFEVIGLISEKKEDIGNVIFDNVKAVASDHDVSAFIKSYDKIGFAVPFGTPKLREKVVTFLERMENVVFPNIIHPSVIFDSDAGIMGQGNHIGPGAIIASEYTIGSFNYISANTLLGHDIILGNYNSINPSATIAGNVQLGNRCLIGMGASIIQGLNIEDDTIIGAGAVLTKNSCRGETLVGIPASVLHK